MKLTLLIAAIISTLFATSQPKVVTQAIITTSTNVIAPDEDEDVARIEPQGGGGGNFNFRNILDGETKTTTYIKNDLVKTDFKSESAKGTSYRDNTKKSTIVISEIMGNKTGTISTDADQVEMKKSMDSMISARMKADTNMAKNLKPKTRNVDPITSVVYLEETKKIAGYTCKKALVIQDKIIRKDTAIVWYNPEIKFESVASTGGSNGVGMFSNMFGGQGISFENVNGFVMEYSRKMPRGRMMEVKVTKIVTDKEIAAKEFDVPKDIELKSMKDMMRGGAGNMRVMFGGARPQ